MIHALVGGSFGSEGKGAVAALLHDVRHYEYSVRVGAANAGHTVYDRFGEPHVMQQIPCAAYVDVETKLLIGPGAQISPEIFRDELVALNKWRGEHGLANASVIVDPRAHVITQEQIDDEQTTGLAERIGSTSTIAKEGIGTAQADRVLRSERCRQAGDYYEFLNPLSWPIAIADVPQLLDEAWRQDKDVLLEGTQGTGLSLTTGLFPYCTSRNTTAAGLAADCGIAPNRVSRVTMVMRTYPIRVAGNSGPFYPDSQEILWEKIGIDPENERTTVTKKIRRVATFSLQQAREAAYLNGATEIALMFCDYMDMPYGTEGLMGDLTEYPLVQALVDSIEHETDVPVTILGTGPSSLAIPIRDGRNMEVPS